MKRLVVAALIGFSVVLATGAPAAAVEPVDMPPLSCDELLGKEVADQARADKEAYILRWAEAGNNPEYLERIKTLEFETRTVSPSSTTCYAELSMEGGPTLVVTAANDENLASFNSRAAEDLVNGAIITQEVISDVSITVVDYFMYKRYSLLRNGFIYEAFWRPEWIASAVLAVESRMAELNAPPPPPPSETPVPIAADETRSGPALTTDATSATAPSVLSKLKTLFDVNLTVGRVGAVAGGALVLSALLIFPTFLLQRVVRSRYTSIAQKLESTANWWGRAWRTGTRTMLRLPAWASIGIGLFLASTLASFVSPTFGLNAQSARVFTSIFVSLLVESVLILVIMFRWIRRNGADARVELRLGSLAIVLLTVLFSRLTGFEPGIVFGLVLTLAVLTRTNKVTEAAESLFETVLAIGIGLLAWIGYSAVFVNGWSENVAGLWLQEVLAAVTLGTLTALPIALLPFGDLPGRKIFDYRPIAWLGLYAFVSTLFLGIVMPFPESIDRVSWPFSAWMTFFVGYTVFALAVWGVDQLQQGKKQGLTRVDEVGFTETPTGIGDLKR